MAHSGPAGSSWPWLQRYPKGIAWDMPLPPETLPEIVAAAIARHGPRPCLDFLGRRWSYAAFGAQVERVAGGLHRLGVRQGTRVGLCLPNTPYFVIAFHAALRLGAIVVNYNPLNVVEELAAQVADSGTEVMVTIDLDPVLPRVLAVLAADGTPLRRVVACRFSAALPWAKGVAWRALKRRMIAPVPHGDDRVVAWEALLDGPPPPAVSVSPEEVALLQYTGGTTGRPKGVMLTHRNLCANQRQVQAWFGTLRAGEERMLAVLPFFHVFAMTVAMNGALAMGAELIMLPRYEYAMTMAAIRRRRPTIFPGVPTLFKALLDGGASAADLASIRFCISGGAPLPQQVKREFEAQAGCTLVEGYGLTEAAPVCFCNPVAAENRPGTIGLPLPGIRAEIRDLAPPHEALPPGSRGELCVAGPNVTPGYWGRPEDTAAAIGADGFLRTGDVGIMDDDGYVTLVDRIKDLIISSGFNVYPRAIEEALYRHPDVAAATVVGMPDAYRGESAAAFVEVKPGRSVTPEALRQFLQDKLSAIEMPRLIELRPTLPRTPVGKLSKIELRAELLGRSGNGQQDLSR